MSTQAEPSGFHIRLRIIQLRHQVRAERKLLSTRHGLIERRSDAARMGWDLGRRNNFQIEVGLANLAWGLAAIIVVALNLPIATQAAVCLTMGIYLFAVFVMQLLFPGGQRRGIGPLIGIGTFGAGLIIMGGPGLAAA